MSTKQLEHVRDQALSVRLTLALGGIPTLRLMVASDVVAQRKPRDLEASRREVAAIFGERR